MHLYVELWKAREEWLELPPKQRAQYFEKVGAEIAKLTESGVEIVGFALNDEETPFRADYRYLAVWKMQNMDQVRLLERSVEEAGWHTYFEQVNARGELIPPDKAIEDMTER